MRQYAGFSTAEESNARYRLLLERGQTGLSVAFDLPTQMGYDSDHPLARPEVGRVGVAIDTLDDMRRLFAGIPLDRVTTSMTINAPAAILLLMYQLVAEEGGADARRLGGTIQNDILKEYVARGTYIYPPRPSMRLITDTFAYCRDHLPAWNTISISGYHMREAGCSAAQEIAFTLGHAVAYAEAALAAGLGIDEFGPRLSFFFGAHSNLLEEVAKFRAARRLWARTMHDRFGARDPKSQMLRFHTQTCGVTLTAQQPLTNVVRVALQALSAVLGGTQSLHTNSFDEALALPTEAAATLALRTQQVLAEETGIADSADPLAGSYMIEALTDALEEQARVLMVEVDRLGGAVAAIESGFEQARIHDNAYRLQTEIERGERVIVGVNKYTEDTSAVPPLLHLDQAAIAAHVARLDAFRRARDSAAAAAALDALRRAAAGTVNVLPVMRDCLLADCTLGEICFALRDIWGEYAPPR
jgi:methylmalonyl-CoA mutase N-terminal domain/subunit